MTTKKYQHIVGSLATGGLLLVGLLLLLNMAPPRAHADPGDLFVSPSGSGDCSQGSPCHLQTALSTAINGETIYVSSGVYIGTGAAVITVTKSITLYGGWDGAPTGSVVRDPNAYPTTLDGENARRVLYISGYIAPTVEGFIVTGGNASGLGGDPGGSDAGGGIFIENASPIIRNNVITNNIASTGNNTTYGGGIYLTGNSATALISFNIIANNMANSVDTGKGGALAIRFSDHITFSNNNIQHNVAGIPSNSMGGGVYAYNSPVLVHQNLFQDNRANSADGGFGGGFYSQFGTITLSGNTVISNTAEYGSVTFEYNTNVTLTNNIIAQNPAGGVFVRGSDSNPVSGILVHNTIAQNGKEGVYTGWYGSGNSTLTLTNNIIVGHTTGVYAYPHASPNILTATHTLFYGNGSDIDGSLITSTHEITGSDPLFVDPAGWNYHLMPNSPAIDTGITVPFLTTDIDDDARPWPIAGDYDIGADEARWQQVYIPLVLSSSG